MEQIGVAVVGVGTLGKRHAENLRRKVPEARLIALADADGRRAAQVAAELEVPHYYDNLGGILQHKDIQAVVIASPSKFHGEGIEAGAAHGMHIFCEKPLALSLEDADRTLAVVAKAGVQLQIGFMRRYDPAYAAAQQQIEAGEIGDPVIFKSVGRDQQPPPPAFFQGGVNGTIFSDAAIHDFDLARWMMKDEIAAAHTYAGLLACPELAQFDDVDATLVNMRFYRGGIGNIEAYRKANYGYDIRTEVLGTKGAVHVGYLRQTPFRVLTKDGIRYDVVNHWLVRFADAYLEEMRDFVRNIIAGKPVRVTGQDGRRALAAALAAEQSYRESRAVEITQEAGPAIVAGM